MTSAGSRSVTSAALRLDLALVARGLAPTRARARDAVLRGHVMVNGAITLSGKGCELLARPEIRAAYLEGGR